jgi:hypothetical protein
MEPYWPQCGSALLFADFFPFLRPVHALQNCRVRIKRLTGSFHQQVSLNSPPNRTYTFQRIRLSIAVHVRSYIPLTVLLVPSREGAFKFVHLYSHFGLFVSFRYAHSMIKGRTATVPLRHVDSFPARGLLWELRYLMRFSVTSSHSRQRHSHLGNPRLAFVEQKVDLGVLSHKPFNRMVLLHRG